MSAVLATVLCAWPGGGEAASARGAQAPRAGPAVSLAARGARGVMRAAPRPASAASAVPVAALPRWQPMRRDLPYLPPPLAEGRDPAEDAEAAIRAGLAARAGAGCAFGVAGESLSTARGPAVALGLDAVLRLALCQDPRGRQTLARWQAEQAQWAIERSAARPRLEAGWSGARTLWRQRLPDEPAETTAGRVLDRQLSLSWLLTDFGQQQAREDIAEQAARAAQFLHDAQLQALVQEAAEAAIALQQARLQQAWSASALALGRTLLARTHEPGGPDAPTGVEALELRVRLDRQQHLVQLAEAGVDEARAALAQRLGLDLRAPLPLAWWAVGEAEDGRQAGYEQLLRQAADHHPLLASAEAEWAGAQAEQRLAQRAQRPRLSLQGGWREGRDVSAVRSRERQIGLQLAVPLWSGGEAAAGRDRARARSEAARAGVDQARQQMAGEVWSAWRAMREHARALPLLDRLQTGAAALLEARQQAWLDGDDDLVDVLDAHDELQDVAEQRHAHLAALQLARLRLTLMLGGLATD
ncbi:MAG: hypothetical protein RLY78_968 [Pseudomonadota bacterium]